ncbi:methyl-accepting chemotaxis protein [Tepidibacter formicigenes]|jgi:methyl-accepting chemotaxis protein|uniref:HAMP domain-containing protein n=1 Tax=Tepidibacter formicigenes DSM 15518 TaxID=1123349 RepID=A0A1M6QX94_9FIRM|nr:methyl-accepting chemotaxis protein [Tepidibacter formicigenes]SHK24806.1 HAMP domain-containing protein [Tepidibacter formicigenes DSM 15518]
MVNNFFKKGSIKFKILTIPLIIMFVVVTLISIITINISRSRLIGQMEIDGINLAEQIVKQIQKSDESMEIINSSIEDKIRTLGKFLSKNNYNIDNNYLIDVAKDFNVDEINITDINGNIIYSNLKSSLGSVFGQDHISYPVLAGEKNELMENIRKSRETNNYYKYGYVSMKNGGMVQVGILANKVQELRASLESQTLVDDLAKDESIVYALLVDKDSKIIASSDKERIGKILIGEETKNAIKKGKTYNNVFFYDKNNIEVCDAVVPLYKNGEHIGAVVVGISMDNVNKAISNIIIIISIIALISFIISAIILYSTSSNILGVIRRLVDISKEVASGNLDNEINIKSKDETGILARNFENMIISLKETIHSMREQASKTEDISNHLTSIAQDMTESAENIAAATQDVAKGTSSQADELANINKILTNFTDKLGNIVKSIENVDIKSKEINLMANGSTSNVENVMGSVEKVTDAFKDLISKISTVGDNINQINEITVLINTIADQTNLLALNASIEAARAGEAGKGFAVVADEIRKLAEQTKESSENIDSLINNISSDTDMVVKTSDAMNDELNNQRKDIDIAMASFKKIIKGISEIIPKIDDINNSAISIDNEKNLILEKIEEASAIAEEVSASSEEIAASSHQVSSSTQQVSSTAQTLSDMTKDMMKSVNKFKL